MPQTLIGTWQKMTSSRCSEAYPDRIEFRENGLYFGRKDPPGSFTIWDAGKFTVTGENRVQISTANDANLTYGFSISKGVLTFLDSEECEFQYRKAQ